MSSSMRHSTGATPRRFRSQQLPKAPAKSRCVPTRPGRMAESHGSTRQEPGGNETRTRPRNPPNDKGWFVLTICRERSCVPFPSAPASSLCREGAPGFRWRPEAGRYSPEEMHKDSRVAMLPERRSAFVTWCLRGGAEPFPCGPPVARSDLRAPDSRCRARRAPQSCPAC